MDKSTQSSDALYWTCQIVGWSTYSIISLIFVWLIMRQWPLEFVINTIIYPVSAIILTHLLRGRIKRWRADGDPAMTGKILGWVLVIGVIQALLITANIAAFEGLASASLSVRSIGTSIVSAVLTTGAWTGAYLFFSQSHRRRMVRDA